MSQNEKFMDWLTNLNGKFTKEEVNYAIQHLVTNFYK